jgi:hypothetical protein
MAYASSPSIDFTEIDLTATAVATSTSTGALAGVFPWGPVGVPQLIQDEDQLVRVFTKPTNYNAETFFVGASFLAYSRSLQVNREIDANTFNAVANTGTFTTSASSVIRNADVYESVVSASSNFANTVYVAKYPGAIGNSLLIAQCDSVASYNSNLFTEMTAAGITAPITFTFTPGSNQATAVANTAADATLLVANTGLTTGSVIRAGNTSIGTSELRVTSIARSGANVVFTFDTNYSLQSPLTIAASSANTTFSRMWEYYDLFDRAPGTSPAVAKMGGSGDELHVVVIDRYGKFTGQPGAVLETFNALSRATDSKTEDGLSNYYVNAINTRSQYIWWTGHRAGNYVATSPLVTPLTGTSTLKVQFSGGSDGADEATIELGALFRGYSVFDSTENIDVSLVMTGKPRGGVNYSQMANYVIDNVGEVRRDVVVFASAPKEFVINNVGRERESIVKWRDDCRYSSYAFYDTGYKQMYDKYNDVYRWVPLNGDMAGLAARTDDTRDAWFSFAGEQRGQLKNVVKLAYNPRKADRDVLYRNDVNSVISTTSMGPHLLGDKTGLGRDSAFSRVNVRRLFIVLEKTIARASSFALFEFNDDFTRAQFRNMVEPFLRDVQGRRGITKYYVQCDERNNNDQVIMSNQFVGSIFVQPNYSINNVKLNFVATRNGVEFETIVGTI